MTKYLKIMKVMMTHFEECSVEYVPSEKKAKADAFLSLHHPKL